MRKKSDDKRLLIGKINGLFGVQGWVKIFSHTDPRKNILSYQPWHVAIGGHWQALDVIQGREQGKTVIAQLKNVDDRERASAYIGVDIYINKSQLPALEKGVHYWDDLIGLCVVNQEKITLGRVSTLVDTGANKVLVINGKKEHWVPYIKPFLIEVDIKKGQILVDWEENF